MAEVKKPAFPQTKDGVTDWERVFENPDDGLIPLISSAPTIDTLHQCATLVIHKLFTRDNDKLEVARLTRQLDALISKGQGANDIGALSQSIIDLLRQIKNDRIRFAREYLASNQKKRRAVPLGERLARSAYNLINHPRFTAIISGVILVFFLVIFGALYAAYTKTSGRSGEKEEQPPPSTTAEEPVKKSMDEPPAPKAADSEQPQPLSEMPPAIVLQRVFLPGPIGGKRAAAGMLLPIIVIGNRKDLDNVCDLNPVFLDALNTLLGRFQARGSKWSEGDLTNIAQQIQNRLNTRAKRKIITQIKLVRSADYRDQGQTRCEFAPDNFLKYLN